jgi:hypothetical protein
MSTESKSSESTQEEKVNIDEASTESKNEFLSIKFLSIPYNFTELRSLTEFGLVEPACLLPHCCVTECFGDFDAWEKIRRLGFDGKFDVFQFSSNGKFSGMKTVTGQLQVPNVKR